MVAKSFYVLVDDIELSEPGALTWNFHAAKGAGIEAEPTARITNESVTLEIIPFGDIAMDVAKLDDHVLPRLQWDAQDKTRVARVGWLLWTRKEGEEPAAPSAAFKDGDVLVTHDGRTWRLPVVQCRAPLRSPMLLISNAST